MTQWHEIPHCEIERETETEVLFTKKRNIYILYLPAFSALLLIHFVRGSSHLPTQTSIMTGRAASELSIALDKSKAILLRLQETSGVPGLSIALSLGDQLLWNEGFGFSDVENQVKCSPDTVMKIASISKPITMGLVARAVDDGLLDLDKDIRTYVSYWPQKYWDNEQVVITARQLASHTGGVRDYKKLSADRISSSFDERFQYEEYYIRERFESVAEAVDLFKDDPLISAPGSRFLYTNHGYTLLSAAVEGASGKPFSDLLGEFLRDAGMSHTYIEDPQRVIDNRAQHYIRSSTSSSVVPAPYMETSFKIAAAGLISTASDLVIFGNLMLRSFYHYTSTSQDQAAYAGLLGAATIRKLWTPCDETSVSWNTHGKYALGWQIIPAQSMESKQFYACHTGRTIGASCVLVVSVTDDACYGANDMTCDKGNDVASQGVVVAILCNLAVDDLNALGCLAIQIADIFDKVSIKNN